MCWFEFTLAVLGDPFHNKEVFSLFNNVKFYRHFSLHSMVFTTAKQ